MIEDDTYASYPDSLVVVMLLLFVKCLLNLSKETMQKYWQSKSCEIVFLEKIKVEKSYIFANDSVALKF